ncbi:unnamed protein product [Malus baccata var. baccata]
MLRPYLFSNRIKSTRIQTLQLSNHKDVISPVNSLQLDLTEGRYLLSGASDASTAVFDVQRGTDYGGGGAITRHKCLFAVDKQHEHGHKYAVSSAVWYPVDTIVMDFKMPGKMYRTAMSPLATSHMLIAAGTEDVQVRLCDIASGAFAHTLSGHRVRFWDIRRARCFHVFDQSQSQLGKRPPILERSATIKGSTVKSSSPSQSTSAKAWAPAPQRKPTNGSGAKHSPIGKSPVKGSMKQRLHPGMLSSQDRATAHYGAVTGLKVTEDAMYLLSAGSDSRLRLWDIESGCNTSVNFETVRMQTSKPIQLATSQNSELVLVPCMTAVKAFDMLSGKTSVKFRGHYEHVNCCWFNSQDQELYTGGNDRQILVWSPIQNEMQDKGPYKDEDNWSD